MNLSRTHLPLFRIFFNLFMVGVVLFSALFQAGGAFAGPQADDPAPPDGNPPVESSLNWLDMVSTPDQLHSEYELELLAGKLIIHGLVTASGCPNGGLLDGSKASQCGVQAAMPVMIEWQNQFNAAIISASEKSGVPPIVLKNIFAWESQFWPQTVFVYTSEYGLGHLTDLGADSALRWNYAFYQSVCRESLSPENCEKYYVDQPAAIQSSLRGVVVQKANADCSDCAYGLDLKRAEKSIPVFATTLLANARLVQLYVQRFTGSKAEEVVEADDLWRFSLASYNAGPGCFKSALSRTVNAGKDLNWWNLSSNLDAGCRGASPYVDFVSKTDFYHPDRAPVVQPTPAPTEAVTVTETSEPTESATPESTTTPEAVESPTVIDAETPTETLAATSDVTSTPEPPAVDTATPEAQPATPTSTVVETATAEPFTATPEPTATATLTATPAVVVTEIPSAPEEQQQSNYAADELVVKFKDFPANLFSDLVLASVGATVEQSVDSLGAVVISFPAENLPEVLESLNNNMLVDYAEPNYVVQAFYTPTDPGFILQSDALTAMQIPEAWDVAQGAGVIVAVIDTGVDTSHPDLSSNIWTNAGETGTDASGNDKSSNGVDDDNNGYVDDWRGWNFASGNNNPSDDNGHGTHIAGVIAAGMDNGIGIAGIAPQAQVMALKALDDQGSGTYASVSQAILYAVDNGAKVINIGLGGSAPSDILQAAVDYAESRGVLVVAAAGNTGSNEDFFPAAYPAVISVAAVDNNLTWASFSSHGVHIDLAAPGIGIYSTLPGGNYGNLSGTSLSAAEVSGVAALLASRPQFDTAAKIHAALLGSGLELGTPGWDMYYGSGLVQALDALLYTSSSTPTPTSTLPMTDTNTPGASPTGGVSMQALETLWGTSVTCSAGAITNPAASTDSAFNNTGGSCANFSSNSTWTYDGIQNTTFTTVTSVNLNVRLYAGTGYSNDTLRVDIHDGTAWITDVAVITPTGAYQTTTFNVSTQLNTIAKINAAQVRLVGRNTGQPDTYILNVDEISLDVDGSAPTDTPTATPTFTPSPTFTPTPTSTPTASSPSPHDGYNGSTDQCAVCHRTHSAQSPSGDLVVSALDSNDYCYSCHDGSGASLKMVSTHSNADYADRVEGSFELLCVQCHDPHGGTSNLFMLRTRMRLSPADPTLLSSPVTFTDVDDPDSYDNGSGSGICVACHTNTSNPGYPMTDHTGGAGHDGGNFVGQKCTTCHKHSTDNSQTTNDGFMPADCLTCHAVAQDNGDNLPVGGVRQIVGLGGDFVQSSHHVTDGTTTQVVTSNDCLLCHDQSQHTGGTVRLFNVDNPATVYALDNVNDAADYDNFCISCHDANGNGGDITPFSDNRTVTTINSVLWATASHNTSVSSFTGSCSDCHDNGHGSSRTNMLGNPQPGDSGTADDPSKQQEAFCYQCHDASGPASTDVAAQYNTLTRWINQAGGLNNNTNLNDRHDITTTDQTRSGVRGMECSACHNVHADNAAQPFVLDPDTGDGRTPGSVYFAGANRMTDYCVDCHDGGYSAKITQGPTTPLVDILGTYTNDSHGTISNSPKTLRAGTGYTTNMTVQCLDCHNVHPSANRNLFQLKDIVMNMLGTVPLPSDGTPYEFTSNANGASQNTNGYFYCNTCHTGSMGQNQDNCVSCHRHGDKDW